MAAKTILADTSALYAVLVAGDSAHARARAFIEDLEGTGTRLATTSYVLQETVALLQARCGVEAVERFQYGLAPLLDIRWVDGELHDRAMAALLASKRCGVSLTDRVSFLHIRDLGIRTAFTFDRHFEEEGFRVVP